ncbi:hypothetical protein PIB30_086883 [Stylosanthes scabra]|uniref:Uncharacterized protein n=1 Tax=Stylosanthes scabra TaxID=79078 RepID=A0ABU6RTW2_9FABA|nr:hypothetical protein [Stylosanthes scabra]
MCREVNEGIHGINFLASDNSGLSVVKGYSRNTHVVKYRHMVITWKPPIITIEQALGRYVASSGKYMLGVIRDIYGIGRKDIDGALKTDEKVSDKSWFRSPQVFLIRSRRSPQVALIRSDDRHKPP